MRNGGVPRQIIERHEVLGLYFHIAMIMNLITVAVSALLFW